MVPDLLLEVYRCLSHSDAGVRIIASRAITRLVPKLVKCTALILLLVLHTTLCALLCRCRLEAIGLSFLGNLRAGDKEVASSLRALVKKDSDISLREALSGCSHQWQLLLECPPLDAMLLNRMVLAKLSPTCCTPVDLRWLNRTKV